MVLATLVAYKLFLLRCLGGWFLMFQDSIKISHLLKRTFLITVSEIAYSFIITLDLLTLITYFYTI